MRQSRSCRFGLADESPEVALEGGSEGPTEVSLKNLASLLGRLDLLESLDQCHLVSKVVVTELVHQTTSQHDPKAPFAQAQFVSELDVSNGIRIRSGVGKVLGVKARPLILNDEGDAVGVDLISQAEDQVGVLAVAPFDGVSAHFHHRLLEVLDLPIGQGRVGKEVGKHVVGLLKVSQFAANVEVDLAVRASLQMFLVPLQRVVDGAIELLRGEWLDEVAIGPDPDARRPMVHVLQRRHHDDRDQVGFPPPLELIADGETVDVWEHEVKEDELGLPLGDRGDDLSSGVKLDRFEAACANQTGEDIVGIALIVDDQNGARHGQHSRRRRQRTPHLV